MFPLFGIKDPSSAFTWIPEIVKSSFLSVPEIVKVTVIVVVVTLIEAAVMFFEAENDTDPTPLLNFQPVGTVKIKVPDPAKSPVLLDPDPSETVISPSVVKVPPAGDVEFNALSAEILVPPDAGLTITVSVNNTSACKPEVCPSAVNKSVSLPASSSTIQ